MSVCLFVCLSVCLSARTPQKPHVQISTNFLYMFSVAVAWFASDGNTIMLCTSGFVDDVMFPNNGRDRPNQ